MSSGKRFTDREKTDYTFTPVNSGSMTETKTFEVSHEQTGTHFRIKPGVIPTGETFNGSPVTEDTAIVTITNADPAYTKHLAERAEIGNENMRRERLDKFYPPIHYDRSPDGTSITLASNNIFTLASAVVRESNVEHRAIDMAANYPPLASALQKELTRVGAIKVGPQTAV